MSIATPASPYYSPRQRLTPNVTGSKSSSIPNIPILVAAFLSILATGGPTYSFGVYASTLKDNFSLSQAQLDTLGASSFAAGLISWIPGLCVDAWGSRRALIVGGLFQSLGLLAYWTVARFACEILSPASSVPTLSFISVVIFTSNNLVIGGVFKAIVVSCELGTKGKAVGAGKAYLGLGAGVYSCLFRALRQYWTASDLDFLAMSACLAIVTIAAPTWLVMPKQSEIKKRGTRDDSTSTHYTVLYSGILLLAMVVVGTSASFMFQPIGADHDVVSDAEIQAHHKSSEWIHGVVVLALWIGPIVGLLGLPTKASSQFNKMSSRFSQSAARRKIRKAMEVDDEAPPVDERSRLVDISSYKIGPTLEDENDASLQETPQPVADLTLSEMLQTAPSWLLLGACAILVGSVRRVVLWELVCF